MAIGSVRYSYKKSGRQQKYFANERYFSKWSHNMAYCLGFITADGTQLGYKGKR